MPSSAYDSGIFRDMFGTPVVCHGGGTFGHSAFIGLDPNTGFLGDTVELDPQGFVTTDPATYMTSLPGVFAAGDVRKGSTKQLASAVGEGAAVAIQIRQWLDRFEAREEH